MNRFVLLIVICWFIMSAVVTALVIQQSHVIRDQQQYIDNGCNGRYQGAGT